MSSNLPADLKQIEDGLQTIQKNLNDYARCTARTTQPVVSTDHVEDKLYGSMYILVASVARLTDYFKQDLKDSTVPVKKENGRTSIGSPMFPCIVEEMASTKKSGDSDVSDTNTDDTEDTGSEINGDFGDDQKKRHPPVFDDITTSLNTPEKKKIGTGRQPGEECLSSKQRKGQKAGPRKSLSPKSVSKGSKPKLTFPVAPACLRRDSGRHMLLKTSEELEIERIEQKRKELEQKKKRCKEFYKKLQSQKENSPASVPCKDDSPASVSKDS